MAELIAAMILLILSIGSFTISIFSFHNKGYLFHNAYLFASKQERSNMDKKPYYRQSAVVFLFIGIIFLLIAVGAVFHIKWIFYIEMVLVMIVVVYAVVSSIAIEKKK